MGSPEDLFAHLPADVKLDRPLDIPAGKSEYEIVEYFNELAAQNANGYASFLGAGVYRHYRPVVIDPLATRGEFLTAYTPYQAEISQGVLTTIFEFQTMIAQLTGMDVANASMYDGSTAVPEAGMMAVRITRRDKLLVAKTLHPEYREVLNTYGQHQTLPVDTVDYDPESGQLDLDDLDAKLDDDTAAVIVQSPNFFGVIDKTREAAEIAHRHGALLVLIFTEAASLGLIDPTREADIVAGEMQSYAHTAQLRRDPFVGVLATKEKNVRQIPGRLVGETVDSDGNRAFCLTLATREQHIRRAKATSNICTNQALIALMATIYMSVFGKQGLRELAEQNVAKSHYLADAIQKAGGQRAFSGPFFNEFVIRANGVSVKDVNQRALDDDIVGGLPLSRFYPELDDALLVCATEVNKRDEMDRYAAKFKT